MALSRPSRLSGIHAALHQAAQNLQGMDMLPAPFRPRIDPDGALEMADQSLHPDLARLLVPMLDRAAGLRDLIGAHGGVADEDQPPVRAVAAQDLEGRRLVQAAPPVGAPQPLIGAVVEMEGLEMLELGPGGGEELLAGLAT